MTRPSRFELLSKFFPELKQPGTQGDKEASLRFNTLACEAILADQLHLFDIGFRHNGPGLLCVRLRGGAQCSEYLPVDDLRVDQAEAKRAGDSDVERFLADAISQIGSTNFEKCGLVLLIDNSSMQVFPIDRDYPARAIQAMLEEFAA
jgi:hypothetical protein